MEEEDFIENNLMDFEYKFKRKKLTESSKKYTNLY